MSHKITKSEYDRLGGMRNGKLYRKEINGEWAYYSTEYPAYSTNLEQEQTKIKWSKDEEV